VSTSTTIYETVTARIIDELESGAAPWVRPWRGGATGLDCLPCNAVTGRFYSGANILILWDAAQTRGYPLPRWLTFRQARQQGGHVRKGERGTNVVFLKSIEVDEEKDGERKRIRFLRGYTVLNVDQVGGLPEQFHEVPEARPEGERHEAAQAFLGAIGADVRHGGGRACYIPSVDRIDLPTFAAFDEPETYYATSLHEHGHWSGHTSRLDRDLRGRFGDEA
jgi:antirestriction protein ArdC